MKFIVTQDLMNKILNYLASKPFSEVNPIISEMKSTVSEYKESVKELG